MKLYEVALIDETQVMINLEHIESLMNKESGAVTVTMASGAEYDVVPQTLNMAIQHSQSDIFRLTPAVEQKAEEPVKEVEGELVD